MPQTWQEKREKQRAQRLHAREERRQRVVASMTVEELERYDEVHREFKQRIVAERRLQRQAANERLASAPPIVIDLCFYELMTASELRSLHQQLLYCYGISRQAERPLKLHLLGYRDDALQLSRVSGFEGWQVTFSDELDTAARRYVYLTADSASAISELAPDATYVIGGLVDKNRHKGACLRRAEALGLETARVDIREHCRLRTSQVVTVDQIYRLMTLLHGGAPLAEAVRRSVPQRKVAGSTELCDER